MVKLDIPPVNYPVEKKDGKKYTSWQVDVSVPLLEPYLQVRMGVCFKPAERFLKSSAMLSF